MRSLPVELVVIVCNYLGDNQQSLATLCHADHRCRDIVYGTYNYQICHLLKDNLSEHCSKFHYLCKETDSVGLLRYGCCNLQESSKNCLRYLCKYKRLEVASWLVKIFDLTFKDTFADDDTPLGYLCRDGRSSLQVYRVIFIPMRSF